MSNLWIKYLPNGWQILSLARVLSRNDGGVWGDDSLDGSGIKVLRSTEITQDGKWSIDEPAVRKLSSQELRSGLLKSGDLLLTKSSGSPLHLGKVALVNKEMEESEYAYSNFMQRLRATKKVTPEFLFYILSSSIARSQINYWGLTTSGLVNLTAPVINRFIIPVPPVDVQKKIIGYLDQKVAGIDEAIAKKKKLIGLLEEKRRRQITAVMTKGLNEKTFRESGVEWLGKTPKSYQQTYLLDVAFERKEKNYKGLGPQLLSLSYGKIINKDINQLGGLLPDSFDTYQLVKPGNIVLRLTDLQNDHVSLRVGIVEEPGMITSAYSSLTAKPKILPKYLYYYVHSADLLKVFYSMGGGVRQSMKFDDLKRLPVILPEKKIQEKIVNYLDSYNNIVDVSKKKMEDSIALLEEYKTSLISNAVTGKVKI